MFYMDLFEFTQILGEFAKINMVNLFFVKCWISVKSKKKVVQGMSKYIDLCN